LVQALLKHLSYRYYVTYLHHLTRGAEKKWAKRQCEQAPQVANSMLVGEWDNSLAQAGAALGGD